MKKTFPLLTLICLLFVCASPLQPSTLLDERERREVGYFVERFKTRERDFFLKSLSRADLYLPFIRAVLGEEGLLQELAWLPLIESGFNQNARSRAGAVGMWQLMEPTARRLDLTIDLWVDERRDPFASTRAAAKLLKYLHRYYGDWALALAAYNAGMGRVDRARRLCGSEDFWTLSGKGCFNRETREYVPRYIAAAYLAENRERHGLHTGETAAYPPYEVLTIDRSVDVTMLSARAGVSLTRLLFLNPELKRRVTPPGRVYNLRVPAEKIGEVTGACRDLPAHALEDAFYYTVREGDTLDGISGRFRTSQALLRAVNGIDDPGRLYAGTRLLVPRTGEGERSQRPMKAAREFTTKAIGYTVDRGDTLWELARRFGVDVETILSVNGMSYQSIIRPGDRITIPVDTPLTP